MISLRPSGEGVAERGDRVVPLVVLVTFVTLAVITLWMGVHRNGDAETHRLAYRGGEEASWNSISIPNSNDIQQSDVHFIAWWSPGHVLIPLALEGAGIPPYRSRAIINVACVGLGLWGVVWLGTILGVSSRVAMGAAAVLLCSPLVAVWFVYFGAGNALFFGFYPWACGLVLRHENQPARAIFTLVGVSLLGFLLKSSFLIVLILLAGLLCVKWGVTWWANGRASGSFPLRSVMGAGIAVIAVILLLKLTYLDRGETPTGAAYTPGTSLVVPFTPNASQDIAHALGGSISALLPFEFIGSRLGEPWKSVLLWSSAGLFLFTLGWGCRRTNSVLAMTAVVICCGTAAFFALQFLLDTSISWDGRHFLPSAVILALVWVALWQSLSAAMKVTTAGLWVLLAGLQLTLIGMHRFPVWYESTVIVEGDTVPKSQQEVWMALREIDILPDPQDRIIYIHPWSRVLERAIEHSRLIPRSPGLTGMPSFRANGAFPGQSVFRGNGPEVYLIASSTQAFDEMIRAFPDYVAGSEIRLAGEWQIHRLSPRELPDPQ